MSKREYETIDAEEQRIKYIYRTERNIKLISYDKEDENDYEYNLIKALFFEQKSLREYSKIVGKHWTCIQDDRNKIFDKLKKIIKI